MNNLIRCITTDGGIVIYAVDTTYITARAQRIHGTSPVATAALGRLLAASSMMGIMLKNEQASITLRVKGDGPIESVIAVADSRGCCKGYVGNPMVDLPNKKNGKLDVGGAVGKGLLHVMKDPGFGEPFIGTCELISGEIAEDITGYYALSEQIPTVCSLGVLLGKEDHKVICAGGLLLQLLPGCDEESIPMLEENVSKMPSFTTMLASGMTLEEICQTALKGFTFEVLDSYPVEYVCKCSRERVEKALATLSEEELRTLPDESGYAEVKCHFCDRVYRFTHADISSIQGTVIP